MKHQCPADPVDRPAFWEPPVAFLKWAIGLILGSCAAFLIVLYIVAPEQLRTARGGGPVVLSLVAMAGWVLLSRGRIKASAYVLGAGLWSYTTGIALLLGGSNSMLIIAYPVIITLAGWLLGPRAAVAVAMLTAAVCFGLFQAESEGLLPPRPSTSAALLWIVQTTVFAFAALLIANIVGSYRNRLEQVRRLGSDLALRTAEVQAREADLNRAQAVAHVGSWVYDVATDVMRLSAETCRIFGLPEGTAGSRESYLSRVHAEDRGAVDSAWQAALKGGEPFDNAHRILVGKTILWVRQKAELVFGDDLTPLRGVGITQDITERKQAEEALRLTRIGVETASDALFWITPDARIVDVNAAACRSLGYTREELLQLSASDVDIDFDAERWPQHFAALRQRGSITFESRHRTKDGRLFPVEIVANHVQIGADERNCAFVRNISERKRHEAEALAARNQLEATLDAIPDLLFEVGLDGRFHDYHSPRSELLLASPGEFLGKKLSDILPPDVAAVALAALREAHEAGSSRGKQYELQLPQGKRWFELSVSRKPVGPGQEPRFIALSRDITERKQAEEELRKRNAFVESLLESAPIGFAVNTIDDGRLVFVGRNFEKIYGLAPGSVHGVADFFEKVYLDPVQREKMRERVMADMASGDAARMRWENIPIRTQAGERKVISASNIALPEQNLMISTVQDVTESHRAQLALRESEERYRTLFANSNVAMLLVDPADGGIVDANSAACAYYGWDLPELRAMRMGDINTLSPEEMRVEIDRAQNMGKRHFEFRHRLAHGEVRDVEVFSGPVEIDGRQLFLSIVQDVTERKKAQEELRKSIAFRELLLEAMPLPVFYKDTSGRYAGGNSAFARFLGKSMKDIVGRTVFEVSPRSLAQTHRDRDLDLLDDPLGVQTYESQVVHADGTPHDVIFHKARMVDDAGRSTGILGVITDITEIKRVEAARDQLEAQLRESQKMEALGTLAGGVAHDFNNIVATIMGNVELALEDVGPDHAALESLEEIRKASRRAKDLVQQILAFGRRQVLERQVIALAPVVEQSARLLRSTLPAGVSLRVECAPDAPPVLADASQVQQVLLNLCGNAWQAMQGQRRPGVIEVRLEAYHHAPREAQSAQATDLRGDFRPGRYACLTVRDNGSGMDEATLERIFEPFFTTKPVGKGTGLGLAVVHGIAQSHGAGIEVQSAPGEGATFRICFPAVEAPVPAAAAQAPDSAPAHGQGRHILYVDDDEAIVFLMQRMLERQGYRVSGHTDARAALAAVRAQPEAFDLAVTDYNMPGMSGLEVARELREIRADLPVALASGYITEELRAQAPAAGVIELVYKPNTVGELCEVVARLANAQRGKENSA